MYVCMYVCMYPKIRGTVLGVPINKDYSILGSIFGFPYFGKLLYIYIYMCPNKLQLTYPAAKPYSLNPNA